MDVPIEDRNLSLFCLLDVIFTRGHHGLPDFPQNSWINSPSEWDYIQYLCPLYPTEHGGWVDPTCQFVDSVLCCISASVEHTRYS